MGIKLIGKLVPNFYMRVYGPRSQESLSGRMVLRDENLAWQELLEYVCICKCVCVCVCTYIHTNIYIYGFVCKFANCFLLYIMCVRRIKCYCPKSLMHLPFIMDASRITGVLTGVTGCPFTSKASRAELHAAQC